MKAKHLLVFSCATALLASSPLQVHAVEDEPSESIEEYQKVRNLLSSFEVADFTSAVESLARIAKSLAERLAPNEAVAEEMHKSIDQMTEHLQERQEILNQMSALASTIDSGVTDEEEEILKDKLAALKDEYKENTVELFVSLIQASGAPKQDAEKIAARNPLMASIIAFIQTGGLAEFHKYL